ncbi:hypothetical protein MTO96_015353 [Rhipicephalus appendiculatus]
MDPSQASTSTAIPPTTSTTQSNASIARVVEDAASAEDKAAQRRARDAVRKRAAGPEAKARAAERRRAKRAADPELRAREADERLATRGVLLRRCPCGQVLNTNDASQSLGWKVRRDVSIQCGLQQMAPPASPGGNFSISSNCGEHGDRNKLQPGWKSEPSVL